MIEMRTYQLAEESEANYELFADNIIKHVKISEMREGYLRKGRENELEVLHFYDKKTKRVVCCTKPTGEDPGKFITGWKMDNPEQLEKFLETNNLI